MIRLSLIALAGSLWGLGLTPAQALVISATNSIEGVVDGTSDTRTVAFAPGDLAGSSGLIQAATIGIDFTKCAGDLTAPLGTDCATTNPAYPEEIVLRLLSPLGTEVSLVESYTYFDRSSYGRVGVSFDDLALDPVGGFAGALENGTFYPLVPLATLVGENALGTWTLYYEDTAVGDALGLGGFTLNITVPDGAVVAPVPGALALLGLGLLGLGAARRRGVPEHRPAHPTAPA